MGKRDLKENIKAAKGWDFVQRRFSNFTKNME
jgi:hypothetical protein